MYLALHNTRFLYLQLQNILCVISLVSKDTRNTHSVVLKYCMRKNIFNKKKIKRKPLSEFHSTFNAYHFYILGSEVLSNYNLNVRCGSVHYRELYNYTLNADTLKSVMHLMSKTILSLLLFHSNVKTSYNT